MRPGGDTSGIDPATFAVHGGTPDGKYVLDERDGQWVVYFAENGRERGLEAFTAESAARTYLLRVLTNDPTTRLPDPEITHVGVLAAMGRILLTPSDRSPGPLVDNLDAGRVVDADAAPSAIASAVLDVAGYQPRDLQALDWGSSEMRRRQTQRRNQLLTVFGVARAADWLGDAKHLAVTADGQWLTLTPSHHSRRDREAFDYLEPDVCVRTDDSAELIAEALREALDRCT